MARLIIHRYAMLGVPDEQGQPQAGKPCRECGNATMIHKDGCDHCTACGHVGQGG